MIVGVLIHPLWLNTGPVIAEESSPVVRTRKMIKRTKKARRTTRRTTRQVAVSTYCDLHPIWEMVSNPHITDLKMVEPRGHQLTHFAYILRMVAVVRSITSIKNKESQQSVSQLDIAARSVRKIIWSPLQTANASCPHHIHTLDKKGSLDRSVLNWIPTHAIRLD